jgi:arsenite-transporting ATPase
MVKEESKAGKNILGAIWNTISGSSECCASGESCCTPTSEGASCDIPIIEIQTKGNKIMNTLTIYDPPMCCSSGVCGPNVNNTLVEFAGTLKTLRKQGVTVRRWNLAQQPQAFAENPKVKELLAELGKDGLPFIFVNNELKTSGHYPKLTELYGLLGIETKTYDDNTSTEKEVLSLRKLIDNAPRFLFFTGKGGVGKTSMSCLVALGLAARGKSVLLISTDPASNLDEVLETQLSNHPTAIINQPGLWAMNIDPIQAATEYRERIVSPLRGVLPDETVQSIEEQLSGACTVEIAAFNEFSGIIGDEETVADYNHVILDTAPTGHTLRLLNLPAAWNDFVIENTSGNSCLGPLSGLKDQRVIYEKAVNSLMDSDKTLLLLVTRAEEVALKEAARTSDELSATGMKNQHLLINGLFESTSADPVAAAFASKTKTAMDAIPQQLVHLPRTVVGFKPRGFTGIKAFRETIDGKLAVYAPDIAEELRTKTGDIIAQTGSWEELLETLEKPGKGLIMTMGKGGVGKTSMATAIAIELAKRGHLVHLSTTDPAAHIQDILGEPPPNLKVSRIDPIVETHRYVENVLERNRGILSDEDMSLLEEELRSPCITEIAVFQAFAQAVAMGYDHFMVLDTAPTGHTLLLLDATESYHRESENIANDVTKEVKELLPHLRDSDYTRILLVTLPEATPVHEAKRLQDDLRRAQIEPFAWIINQSFALSKTTDTLLATRGVNEIKYIKEVTSELAKKVVISPWLPGEIKGVKQLQMLLSQN